jgi:hypothetical protein
MAECACGNCLDLLEECQEEEGCMEIIECAARTGCNGVACYLGPCMAEIDAAGVNSPAVSVATLIGECVDEHSCPGCR